MFDHTARLADGFILQPDDFAAFPAPAGPTGRGFMPVLARMAVPETAPDMHAAMKLITNMLAPEIHIATLRAANVFSVIGTDFPDDMSTSVQATGAAITAMSGAERIPCSRCGPWAWGIRAASSIRSITAHSNALFWPASRYVPYLMIRARPCGAF